MAIDPEGIKLQLRAAIECSDATSCPTSPDAEPRDRLPGNDRTPGDQGRPLGVDLEATDAHEVTRSFSSQSEAAPGDHPTVDWSDDDRPNPVDTIIADRYKVRQEIGEGGMGTVYFAEQLRPLRRFVALKLIKRGMDSRNVLARFESERQALALMEHPNIARALDAGTTADGRPFFAMELVKGLPITEYCDAHRLDLNARLGLFRKVCSAVQHAHQKGIIHRDLKPSNILVESHDDRPVPKVIDFGLAKAVGGRLTEQSLCTAIGCMAGTPMYMAPEQASLNASDIDTRADIYALGVILYELLTGSTPIACESIRLGDTDVLLRMIREVEPPTPSSRISTSEALPTLAANRQVEPARLSRLVRGDLDWIAMKAIAKERERRYASAIGLADDIERYLNHEPVSASPPTTAYRLRKFIRRNRGRVTAAGLVLLALALGVIGTTLGLIEAGRLRQQAERRLAQVTKMNDILGSIFKDLDPKRTGKDGEQLSVVLGKRLDRATDEIEGEATGDPLAVARMQMTLGRSQWSLGHPDRAISLFAKARTTFAAELGPDHPETLRSMNNLAVSHLSAGRNDRALKLLGETLALQQARLGPGHPETLMGMINLAESYAEVGQNDRALKLFEETLALQEAKLGPGHPETAACLEGQARCLANSGQLDLAGAILDQVIALLRKTRGEAHPGTFQARLSRAELDLDRGRLDAAEAADRAILDECRSRFGAYDRLTIAAGLALAGVRQARGDRDLAATLYIAALESARKNPTDRDTLAAALMESGRSRIAAGDWITADAQLREARAILEAEKPQHWVTAEVRSLLGEALIGEKKTAEATPLLRSGYEGMVRAATAIPRGDRPRLYEALDRLIAAGEAAGTKVELVAWKAERAKLGGGGPKP